MSTGAKSRRAFLRESAAGLGASWVAANYPGIVAAQEFVQATARSGEPIRFAFFTPAQAVEVEAVTARIIPADETPGAREARVVAFIDRALVTFERGRQPDYIDGLDDLAAQTAELFPGVEKFSALSEERQIRVLTALEDTPFFELVRIHTITGFFASPLQGGNHDKIGWALIGYDDSLDHEPPFGYYDALLQRRA